LDYDWAITADLVEDHGKKNSNYMGIQWYTFSIFPLELGIMPIPLMLNARGKE
jgi:hypothetical protein